MAFNIHAVCSIGSIVSRRIQPGRAVKQARDYRRRGYTHIRIVEVETGEEFDSAALAARIQASGALRAE